MEGLAYIGMVTKVIPIPEADKIESLEVVCGKGGKWRGTAQKGQFIEGAFCRVFLQDSIVPNTAEFSFMEKNNWRIRMIRLRGTPSEVLIMPVVSLGVIEELKKHNLEVGADITEAEGILKYEKPIPVSMSGLDFGSFPSNLIPKTDETLFQKVPYIVEIIKNNMAYSTLKIDGSSATIYQHEDHFGCCSRNLEKREHEANAIWMIANKYGLRERMKGTELALQFEIAGPGIQKNKLGLKEPTPFLFDVYDIGCREYLGYHEMMAVATLYGFPIVPLIDKGILNFTDDESMRKYAERKYPNGANAEGVVIRPLQTMRTDKGERVSFKIINLLYKEG